LSTTLELSQLLRMLSIICLWYGQTKKLTLKKNA